MVNGVGDADGTGVGRTEGTVVGVDKVAAGVAVEDVGDWIGANVRNTPSFVRRFTLESFFVCANTTLKSATVKNALIYILFC